MNRTLCKTCKEKACNRPGGLCSACYRVAHGPPPVKVIDPSTVEDVDLYAAMKHVLAGLPCVGPLQKACRQWLADKTSAFMDRFSVLEAAKLGAKRPELVDAPDEGHDSALRAMEEWLRANGTMESPSG